MMVGTRSALLAAGLLVAVPATAAQPDGGHYVWVPEGATVVLVPSSAIAPAEFPVARMIAQQQAMMNRMFADMPCQRTARPHLGGVSQLFRFAARHMHYPGFSIFRNPGVLRTMVGVLQCCTGAHCQGLADPS